MGEPARRLDDSEQYGSGRPRLQGVQGGGKGNGKPRGQLRSLPSQPVYDDDSSGQAVTRPNLRLLEGGASASGAGGSPVVAGSKPGRPQLQSVKAPPAAEDLEANEAESDSGYYNDTDKEKKQLTRTQKIAIAGSAIGILTGVGGLTGLSTLQGPLQFIHLANMMENFHFSQGDAQSGSRLLHLAKWVKWKLKGRPERARLTLLGNHFVDPIESKFSEAGYEFVYDEKGNFDHIKLDPEKILGKEQADSMKPDEIKQNVEGQLGTTVTADAEGHLTINADDLSFLKKYSLTYNIARASGMGRAVAGLTTRLIAKLAKFDLHPMKPGEDDDTKKAAGADQKQGDEDNNAADEDKVDPETGRTASDQKFYDEEKADIQQGDPGISAKSQDGEDNKPPDADSSDISGQIADLQQEGTAAAGKPAKVAAFKAKLTDKLSCISPTAGGIKGIFNNTINAPNCVLSFACFFAGLASAYFTIRQAVVILPTMRIGAEKMAMGDQIEAHKDISTKRLTYDDKHLNDPKGTTWDSAASIEAQGGKPWNKSTDLPASMNPSGSKNLFAQIITSTGLASFANKLQPVCDVVTHPLTQAAILIANVVLTYFTRGENIEIEDSIKSGFGILIQTFGLPPIIDGITQWLTGMVVDPDAKGHVLGGLVDRGARMIGRTSRPILNGGKRLTDAQVAELDNLDRTAQNQQYQRKSFATKMFDTHDYRSVIGQFIDSQNTSPTGELNHMASGLLNLGKTMASMPLRLMTGVTHAATNTPYDYGFSAFGFTAQEMDNPAVDNPYANAEYVEDMIGPNQGTPPDGAAAAAGDAGAAATASGPSCSLPGIPPYSGNVPTAQLESIYGNSAAAVQANLVPVQFQGHTVQVHKLVAAAFQNVDKQITALNSGYAVHDIGTFNWRTKNQPGGSDGTLSWHSFGIAMDINATTNPYTVGDGPHDIPASWIAVFKANCFAWGGDWDGEHDYMHFQYQPQGGGGHTPAATTSSVDTSRAPKVIAGTAHAAPETNTDTTAGATATLAVAPTGARGADFVNRAKACFDTSISTGADETITVKAENDPPDLHKIDPASIGDVVAKDNPLHALASTFAEDPNNCQDNSTDFLRLRMLIFDTNTMNATACWLAPDPTGATVASVTDLGSASTPGGTDGGNSAAADTSKNNSDKTDDNKNTATNGDTSNNPTLGTTTPATGSTGTGAGTAPSTGSASATPTLSPAQQQLATDGKQACDDIGYNSTNSSSGGPGCVSTGATGSTATTSPVAATGGAAAGAGGGTGGTWSDAPSGNVGQRAPLPGWSNATDSLQNGTATIVADPQKGKAIDFYADGSTVGGHQRVELYPPESTDPHPGKDSFVAMDIMFPQAPPQVSQWQEIMQLKGAGGAGNPTFEFDVNYGEPGFFIAHNSDKGVTKSPAGTVPAPGTWTHLVIQFHVTTGPDSFVTVWQDGKNVANQIPWAAKDNTGESSGRGGLLYGGDTQGYFKFGIYRGATGARLHFLYANLAIGASCDAVSGSGGGASGTGTAPTAGSPPAASKAVLPEKHRAHLFALRRRPTDIGAINFERTPQNSTINNRRPITIA